MIADTKIKNENGRKIKHIIKTDIVREISERTGIRKSDIKNVLDNFEDVIIEELRDVDENNDVSIKPFDGLIITGKLSKEQYKINNLTGKYITIPQKIKVKATTTKFLNNIVNDSGKEDFEKFFNQQI